MDPIIHLMERGWVPDVITRWGIRQLVRQRLDDESKRFSQDESTEKRRFAAQMKQGPIALHTQDANIQHYELPPQFFDYVLGSHKKYSGCFWEAHTRTLMQAEADSLSVSCERAEIQNGMRVLELGCGWGSLSLWMARNYPRCEITAVSNSRFQRDFIREVCERTGISNLQVVTCDMNHFDPDSTYDRILSIEMFEHMRNYRELMNRIGNWLEPGGKLFVHIFCHKRFPYFFETEGAHNWMGRYFFTGGGHALCGPP